MKTKSTLVLLAAIFCFNSNFLHAQSVDVNDSLTLVDFYNNTNGPGWYNKTNWLNGPVSTWYGVTVSGGRVVKIDMKGNGVSGSIPPKFGSLSALTYLDLIANKITDLPSEIGNLLELQTLILQLNQIEKLPAGIGNLSNLTTINLSQNKILSLPPEIGNLTNLEILNLLDNLLTSLPPEIGNLANLSSLILYHNQITKLPAEIGKLSNLEILDLTYNSIPYLPAEFSNLKNLQYLNLSYCSITDFPPEICDLVSLQQLRMPANQVAVLPPEIGNLKNLRYLYGIRNEIKGLPPEIRNLTNLELLNLYTNQIKIITTEIRDLKNLQILVLSDNQISDIPLELYTLSGLRFLSLSLTDISFLAPELENLKSLETLDLQGDKIKILPKELGNLSNLQTLYLSNNQISILPKELGNLKNLRELYLSNNQIADIPYEINNIYNLYRLDLGQNNFTFEDLEPIVPYYLYQDPELMFMDYIPQANIHAHQNGNAISVSAGGTLSKNTYRWFMVGQTNTTTIVGDSVFYALQNGKYYATITNSSCPYLTLYTDTIYYDIALPLTIANFKAEQQGSIIKVYWTSLAEINVAEYEVQRSSNAFDFTTLGSLPAKGNSTQQADYSFNDLQPLQGNNYYRLKAVDKDGKITYSKTALVNISNNKTVTVVYPIPAKDILHVQTNSNTSFSLLNQEGKILLTTNINGSGAINVSTIGVGIYTQPYTLLHHDYLYKSATQRKLNRLIQLGS